MRGFFEFEVWEAQVLERLKFERGNKGGEGVEGRVLQWTKIEEPEV